MGTVRASHWLSVIGLVALTSCATTNQTRPGPPTPSLLAECGTNLRTCQLWCAAEVGTADARPLASGHCDAVALYRSEAAVAGHADALGGVQPIQGKVDLDRESAWMAALCDAGVTRACAARDGLSRLPATGTPPAGAGDTLEPIAKCRAGDEASCDLVVDRDVATQALEDLCVQGSWDAAPHPRACRKAVENLDPGGGARVPVHGGFSQACDIQEFLRRACIGLDDPQVCVRAGDSKCPFTSAGSNDWRVRVYSKACDGGIAHACFGAAQYSEQPEARLTWWRKGCDANDMESCTMAARLITEQKVAAKPGEPAKLFARGCELGSAVGCRLAGKLDRACELHDAPACDKLCASGNAKGCSGASEGFKDQRAVEEAGRKAEAALPGLFAKCTTNRAHAESLRDQAVAAFRAGNSTRASQLRDQLNQEGPTFQQTIEELRSAIITVTGGFGPRADELQAKAERQCLLPEAQ